MKQFLLMIIFTTSLSACGHLNFEPRANPANERALAAEKMKDSSIEQLVQFLAFGDEVEKHEAAYRIGAHAIERNNQLVQVRLTGGECPNKFDFAPAVSPLATALRSEDSQLQYEAASTLLAIGAINPDAFDALSSVAASRDSDVKRARDEHINYLFVLPCPAPAIAAPPETATP